MLSETSDCWEKIKNLDFMGTKIYINYRRGK
jgi:hypothetical protein